MINTQTENDPQFQEYLNGIAQNVDKYGNRAVDNLQYDGDNGYIVIKFKDDVRTCLLYTSDAADE